MQIADVQSYFYLPSLAKSVGCLHKSKLLQNPAAYFCIKVGPVSKCLQVSIILGILDKKTDLLNYRIILSKLYLMNLSKK